MIPELGLFCLILSMCMACLQIGIYIADKHNLSILMRPLANGQTLFVCMSWLLLWFSFVTNDFTLPYVAMNSNSNLPMYYKLTAVWGAHEGSLLLWILILNLWSLAIPSICRKLGTEYISGTYAVYAVLNVCFLCIVLFNSNPFIRNFVNIPIDGMDLNPMLQDLAMILHPPILYTGYVGSALLFAYAVAAVLTGKIDRIWAQNLRSCALFAWLFLTVGIALGSWWAYYELGWGGWWFWDPVENASFMPWLTCTALIHALTVASKSGRLLYMSIFLCLLTFSLSLLGTFLVRSGMIVSVHAFATDPGRGMFILPLFISIVCAAFAAFVWRLVKSPNLDNSLNKNSILILYNNIILLVAAATVLLGTIYPLFYEIFFVKQISVGYPYFNTVFVPIMYLMFSVMLLGLLPRRLMIITLIVSAILSALMLWLFFAEIRLSAFIGVAFAFALVATCVRATSLPMLLGHLGLAITIIGISITPAYEIEKDTQLQVSQQVALANYTLKLVRVYDHVASNYVAFVGEMQVYKNDQYITTLYPEKRRYIAREISTTETAIMPGIFTDIYVNLARQQEGDIWAMRVYYKPFVRWIWSGALIMALAAAIAIAGKRFNLHPVVVRYLNTNKIM